MGEPNATVPPAQYAGVRLPTQGIGYAGYDPNAAAVIINSNPLAIVPRNAVPNPLQVVIPFAAIGDILDIDFAGCVGTDTTGGGATECFISLSADDASVAPAQTIAPDTGFFLLPATGQVVYPRIRGGLLVPGTWVFPVTITAVIAGDGDVVFGGGNNGGCALSVTRVPQERATSLPVMILI